MIVVQIHSGLGNQLFMYAAARALAVKHHTVLYLDVDTDCRRGVNHGEAVGHSFQLDKFNIAAEYPGRSAAGERHDMSRLRLYSTLKSRLKENKAIRTLARRLQAHGLNLSRALLKVSGNERRFFREERGDWGYKPAVIDLPDNTILRGCFFSYRYFEPIADLIRDEITLKEDLSPQSKAVQEKIAGTDSVSIHVRRGDVVSDPEYRSWYEGILTERYYLNAVRYFQERLREPHFFIFSDDMDWVRSSLNVPGSVTYVDHNGPDTGYEDLHLMAHCRHNITAGFSSFSWWAAYLNRNPGKIVVRTRRMNALDHLDHSQDFFPPGWIIVDS